MAGGVILDQCSLTRLRDLAPLSTAQFKELAAAMTVREVEKHARICEPGHEREYAYILLSGSVACTCVDSRYRRRKLLKLIPPGVIPILPQPHTTIDPRLKYEAFTNCKIGQTDLEYFFRATLRSGTTAYQHFIEIHFKHWMDVIVRSSKSALGLALDERLGLALLELCSEFGIPDSRGMLLRICPSHEDLADLVGTTRSKVTHALGDFERRGMITRLGRRLVVRMDRIESSLGQRQPTPYCGAAPARMEPASKALVAHG
jgi:CRP-like cAMP-binding protein